MIYIRFNDPFKHCRFCKKSIRLGDRVATPDGLLKWVYWCKRNKCMVTSQCYCDDPNGFEWEPERYYHPTTTPKDKELLNLSEIENRIDTLACEVHGCQDQKIAEKARDIGSIEWVIIESGLEELRKNNRVRDELLTKVQALRDATLEGK